MPSIAEAPAFYASPVSSCKKRRRDDHDHTPLDLSSKLSPSHRHLSILPYLADNQSQSQRHHQLAMPIYAQETPCHDDRQLDYRLVIPRARRLGLHRDASKRQRTSLTAEPKRENDSLSFSPGRVHGRKSAEPPIIPSPLAGSLMERLPSQYPKQGQSTVETQHPIDTSACHICRRRPTQRNELDFYADCERCCKRTCWICIRQCAGLGVALRAGQTTMMAVDGDKMDFDVDNRLGLAWKAHRNMVCSQCCVERGSEGEVWCRGCVEAEMCV